MNVLVSGAAGFIGSHLVRLLLEAGHNVTAIIGANTNTWRVTDILARLRRIECDISDRAHIERALGTEVPDVSIHLAWRGWSGPSLTAEENLSSLAASLEFLRAVSQLGCRRFVGVGTCFEYDVSSGPLLESTPLRPRDLYGFCKQALSAATAELARTGKMDVAWSRVFLVYGPYDDERRLVPSVTLSLLRGQRARTTLGDQLRDLLHVEDAASAIWAVALSSHVGPINVASGQPVKVQDLVRQVADIVGRPDLLDVGGLPYRPGEPHSLVADASLLFGQVGWRPRYGLTDGLADTVEWWRRREAARGAVTIGSPHPVASMNLQPRAASRTSQRVLLTGATGFVGSQLARLLVAEGHEVFAIIRPDANRWRLSDIARALVVLDGDLQNVFELRDRLRALRPDICLHLAWRGWLGVADAEQNLRSLGFSLDLLRLMSDVSCRRFLAVGTCFEYDLSGDCLSETTTLRPRELYGTCKKSLFEVAQHYSTLTGVSVVMPRVFYSYGPFEDERKLVSSITLSLLRGEAAEVTPGQQVRDYLHVEDVASAIWHVATSDVTGGVNIGSAQPVTVADVATRIGRLLGRPDLVKLGAIPYRPDEPMRIVTDAALLRGRLGWSPRLDLDRGLTETVAWWEDHVKRNGAMKTG